MSKTFITEEYKTSVKRVNAMIDEINQHLKGVDKDVMKLYEGKTLISIKTTDIAQTLRNRKAENLSSFQEQLAVGIDLRKQIKLDANEEADIQTINTLLDKYANDYNERGLLEYATISKGKASINDFGLARLESYKITLNKKELAIWEQLHALKDMIYTSPNNKFLLFQVFGNSVLSEFAGQTEFNLKNFKHLMQRYDLK
jgi:hypothetical protein